MSLKRKVTVPLGKSVICLVLAPFGQGVTRRRYAVITRGRSRCGPLRRWPYAHMRFEPSGMTNDPDIRAAKSIVDYIFRWMGKKFLTTDQQEEIGILSPEVRARLAASYNALEGKPADAAVPVEAAPPGQTALFNAFEDAQECARCGGRMVRTGSCYTCRDCGTNTGCS